MINNMISGLSNNTILTHVVYTKQTLHAHYVQVKGTITISDEIFMMQV